MPAADEIDLAHLDYLSRPREQQQVLREGLKRRAQLERSHALRSMLRSQLIRLWRAATFASDAARLVAGACAAAVARRVRRLAEQAERRKAMAELAGMSDRELWDIGLRRSEIYWATQHGRPEPAKRVSARFAGRPFTATSPARADAGKGRDKTLNHRQHAA
jgi:uncharacterized protein YjiS (DUF1127 family)